MARIWLLGWLLAAPARADCVCPTGEKCCNDICVPEDATCCGDGYCAKGAACGKGQCCPDSLTGYDEKSGYCCATPPCGCANPCGAGCCPADSVCCEGGWCAISADQCPACPPGVPTWCPDGTCAPANAICCGEGYYCPYGRACVDAGGGQFVCGDGTIKPAHTQIPPRSAAIHASRQPSAAPLPGDAPMGIIEVNPRLLPGCQCQLGGRAPFSALVLLPLLWLLRRRAR